MTAVYHISDLKKYNRCPRLFLQSQQDEKLPFYSYVRMDEAVSDLAARKLGVEKPFVGALGDDPSLAMEALKDHDWLMKARFEYGGLRIKVPFMHRNGDAWELYFLFTGLYPHNNDMELYCDTVWVLEANGIKLSDVMIVHLNEAYVREDELDIDQLFIICPFLYNFNNNPTIPFFEEINFLICKPYRMNSQKIRTQHTQFFQMFNGPLAPLCIGIFLLFLGFRHMHMNTYTVMVCQFLGLYTDLICIVKDRPKPEPYLDTVIRRIVPGFQILHLLIQFFFHGTLPDLREAIATVHD